MPSRANVRIETSSEEILTPVQEFCCRLDANPPAYLRPLRTDAERIRVMQSRLFNELRAADYS